MSLTILQPAARPRFAPRQVGAYGAFALLGLIRAAISRSSLTRSCLQRFGMVWMLGSKLRKQSELLIVGSLRDFVPDDHVLARVDKVVDPGGLRLRCENATPPMAPDGPALIPRWRCGLCWPGSWSASSTIGD